MGVRWSKKKTLPNIYVRWMGGMQENVCCSDGFGSLFTQCLGGSRKYRAPVKIESVSRDQLCMLKGMGDVESNETKRKFYEKIEEKQNFPATFSICAVCTLCNNVAQRKKNSKWIAQYNRIALGVERCIL